MIRSTKAQKTERLNAAYALLERGLGPAEATRSLSQQFSLSNRQAYRYVKAAQAMAEPAFVAPPSAAFSVKLPEDVVYDLRAYAATSGLPIGEVVRRALIAFLATARRHG